MGAPQWARTTLCSCGKSIYTSRKSARKAAKAIHPDDKLPAYPCRHPLAPNPAWHYGHLPKNVENGTTSRSEIRNLRQGNKELCLRVGSVGGTHGWKCNLEIEHASRCFAQNALGEWLELE